MGQAGWSVRGMLRGMLAAAVALVLLASVGVMQATGAPAEELLPQLRTAVIGYVEGASSLVDAETGALLDPHETIYREGYSPACLAVAAAAAHHWTGSEDLRELALAMIRRSLHCVQEPQPDDSSFTHLFLLYYSLLAYHELAGALPPTTRAEFERSFRELEHGHRPSNTNGLAMALCYDTNLHLMGLADLDLMEAGRRLDRLEEATTGLGFINDAAGRNAHPIAYHLYVASLLSDTIMLADRHPAQDGETAALLARMEALRDRAAGWCDHFVAADGSFTMAERSRDQFWTCGAFVFLDAARGLDAQDHLAWWLRFTKPDGTISVTPNHFSNAIRVGFESYSNVIMYNGLGFAYLALAGLALDGAAPRTEAPSEHPGGLFMDEEAGYVHLAQDGSSLGLALRRHADSSHGGYAAALSPINVSLGGSPRRPLANPSYRTGGAAVEPSRRRSFGPEWGVFEGFVLHSEGQWWGPDWTDNAEVVAREAALEFRQTIPPTTVIKQFELDRSSLTLKYHFAAVRPIERIQLQFPMLISDGRDETQYRIEANRVEMQLGDETYLVTVTPDDLTWSLSQVIYLISTSGAVRQLGVTVARDLSPGDSVEAQVRLERVGNPPWTAAARED